MRLVLDTSVIVEYVVLGSTYRPKVVKLFELASKGGVELYVNPVTLSEVLYVVSRIYQAAGVEDPNGEALDYVEWVKRRARVVELSENIVLRAGELKKLLRMALVDCYVIATAEALRATPLFKEIEYEMRPALAKLRELGVRFLKEVEL